MGCVGCISPLLMSKACWYACWELSVVSVDRNQSRKGAVIYSVLEFTVYLHVFFLYPHCIAAVHKEAQYTDDTLLTLLSIPGCNLRQVSEIIAFHFQVEHLALRSGGVGDEIAVQ